MALKHSVPAAQAKTHSANKMDLGRIHTAFLKGFSSACLCSLVGCHQETLSLFFSLFLSFCRYLILMFAWFAHTQLCRAALCRLPCLNRRKKEVFSKLVWKWNPCLVILSCSYWAGVSDGQIHTGTTLRENPKKTPSGQSENFAVWLIGVSWCHLQPGTGFLKSALTSETSRPLRTCLTEIADFHSWSCCLWKL